MKISIHRLNQRLIRARNLQKLETSESRWQSAVHGNEEDSWRQAQGIRPQGHGKEVRDKIYLHVARSMGEGGQDQGNDSQGQMAWDFGR